MNKTKRLYLTLLALGFPWLLYQTFELGLRPRDLAWTIWAANFLLSPILLVAFQAERIRRKDLEPKLWKRIGASVFITASGLLAIYFVHGIVGAFLSVTNSIEPLYYYGPNGYINHINLDAILSLVAQGSMIIPAFLTLKFSALIVTPAARFGGHAMLRDGVLALIFGTIGTILEQKSLLLGQVIFCTGLFIPWTLIVGRDIIAKKRDKVAAVDPEIKNPTEISEVGNVFWGVGITLFGLVFFLIGLGTAIYILQREATLYSSIVSTVFFLVFGGFGGLAMLIGLNLGFGYTKVNIVGSQIIIKTRQLKPFPSTKTIQENLGSYSLKKHSVYHTDSDGPNYHEYLVELIHQHDKEKNVVLYRAYHEDGFEQKYLEWKRVLDFYISK